MTSELLQPNLESKEHSKQKPQGSIFQELSRVTNLIDGLTGKNKELATPFLEKIYILGLTPNTEEEAVVLNRVTVLERVVSQVLVMVGRNSGQTELVRLIEKRYATSIEEIGKGVLLTVLKILEKEYLGKVDNLSDTEVKELIETALDTYEAESHAVATEKPATRMLSRRNFLIAGIFVGAGSLLRLLWSIRGGISVEHLIAAWEQDKEKLPIEIAESALPIIDENLQVSVSDEQLKKWLGISETDEYEFFDVENQIKQLRFLIEEVLAPILGNMYAISTDIQKRGSAEAITFQEFVYDYIDELVRQVEYLGIPLERFLWYMVVTKDNATERGDTDNYRKDISVRRAQLVAGAVWQRNPLTGAGIVAAFSTLDDSFSITRGAVAMLSPQLPSRNYDGTRMVSPVTGGPHDFESEIIGRGIQQLLEESEAPFVQSTVAEGAPHPYGLQDKVIDPYLVVVEQGEKVAVSKDELYQNFLNFYKNHKTHIDAVFKAGSDAVWSQILEILGCTFTKIAPWEIVSYTSLWKSIVEGDKDYSYRNFYSQIERTNSMYWILLRAYKYEDGFMKFISEQVLHPDFPKAMKFIIKHIELPEAIPEELHGLWTARDKYIAEGIAYDELDAQAVRVSEQQETQVEYQKLFFLAPMVWYDRFIQKEMRSHNLEPQATGVDPLMVYLFNTVREISPVSCLVRPEGESFARNPIADLPYAFELTLEKMFDLLDKARAISDKYDLAFTNHEYAVWLYCFELDDFHFFERHCFANTDITLAGEGQIELFNTFHTENEVYKKEISISYSAVERAGKVYGQQLPFLYPKKPDEAGGLG